MGRGRSKAGTSISFSTTIPQNSQSQQQQPQQPQNNSQNGDGDRGQFSNLDYATFLQQDEATRFKTIQDIVNATDVKVPSYLDPSVASKVVFALGMTNKPQVVDDDVLDGMKGRELFRGVYNASSKITADDIADQIQTGDYTQFSNSGGSLHGRGLYFASQYSEASSYANWGSNGTVIRAKVLPTAKIVKATTIDRQISSKNFRPTGVSSTDRRAVYAISQGISGWYDDSSSGGYTVMVDRGALAMSSTRKNANYGGTWSTAKAK